MQFINQMEPSFGLEERQAIDAYLQSGGWGTEFRQTEMFAQAIAEFTGAKYCVIMPNGTISLTAALLACGIGVGDEVIVPDFTMVATPNAAELIGARALFVDIERETLCMNYESMTKAVTPRTKAVMLVSINGRCPTRFADIVEFCRELGLFLVEDAAQSLGSCFDGMHLGRLGDVGSFSFSMPKIITTGQGGALITDNADIYERLKKIRDFGREKSGSDHYLTMGWNFKFTDFQAVVGIEQMKKLPWRIKRKKEMGRLYYKLLQDLPQVELIQTNFTDTVPWFFDILCENRAGLSEYLCEHGIGVRPFYPPLHSEPAYGRGGSFPVTEAVSTRGLWLPSSIKLTDEDIKYVCSRIRNYYEERT